MGREMIGKPKTADTDQISRGMPDHSQRSLRRSEFAKKYGALLVLLVALGVNMCVTPHFMSMTTVWNLVIHASLIIIVSLAMTFVIATGGIDISVGSTMALSSVVCVMLAPTVGPVPALLVGLLVGAAVGMVNGVLTVCFTIQPMVATLAMLIMLRSLARLVSSAKTIRVTDELLVGISLTRIGEVVPIQLIYVVVFTLIFYTAAQKTVFGKQIEAIGNNRTAAGLSGIHVRQKVFIAYVLVGVMAALAGILSASRTMSCNPSSVGDGMELDVVAAVIIGGTPMSGGRPRILGTLAGGFLIQLVTMTVNMNNIPYAFSMLFKAAIIILAVFIQSEKKFRKKKAD